MTDRPILFSAPMVCALLAGQKTQTRRLAWRMDCGKRVEWAPTIWQKVAPGDRLWVRECFSLDFYYTPGELAWYWADGNPDCGDWTKPKPSIHMPRWASRLTLVVTDVRQERLNDISEADARAEGIVDGGCINCGNPEPCGCDTPLPSARDSFANLWNRLHGEDAWMANPDVVALSFQVEKINIDHLGKEAAE